jgi:hypothetical protein
MADDSLTVTVDEGTFDLSTTTTLSNPAVVQKLTDVGDVDITTNGLNNGSLLIYKESTQKWTSSRLLDFQVMEGGEF